MEKTNLNSTLQTAPAMSDFSFYCCFGKDKWDENKWTLVKSPRWDRLGGWVQKETYIENQTPADASLIEMQEACAGQTYTSMLLNEQFSGPVAVIATMEFTDRMAPLIVISTKPVKDKNGTPEYREHYEIVLFDRGINIWHHYYQDNKPSWKNAAYSRLALKPNTPYKVRVEILPAPKGKVLSVFVADHEFGYMDDSLPDEFYVGITGCEGVNRFHDLEIGKAERKLTSEDY